MRGEVIGVVNSEEDGFTGKANRNLNCCVFVLRNNGRKDLVNREVCIETKNTLVDLKSRDLVIPSSILTKGKLSKLR